VRDDWKTSVNGLRIRRVLGHFSVHYEYKVTDKDL